MDEDYCSIDHILTENQKIQCTFKHKVPGLGYLDGGQNEDIKDSDRFQLPYWLALRPLLETGSAEFQIPQPFAQRVKNALDAESKSVKLSALVGGGGHWYGFGKMVAQLLDDDEAIKLSEVLTKAFRQRLVELMDQAQHFGGSAEAGGPGQGGEDFREGLDSTERDLFSLAQESARQTKIWYESSDKQR